MRITLIQLLLYVSIGLQLEAHPIHVTIVNVDINRDSSIMNYSIRLFYDDFQALINSRYNTFIDFGKQQRMTTKEQQCINDYLTKSLVFHSAGLGAVHPKFVGWKKEGMSIWMYYTSNFYASSDNIQIDNRLMLELFTDQKNMLIFSYNGNETPLEFNQRITHQEIKI